MRYAVNPRLLATCVLMAVLLSIVFITFNSLDEFAINTMKGQEEKVSGVIKKAALTCYALEGQYPPNIEYLEEHYGVILDRESYVYYYSAFASNVFPEIIVKSLITDTSEPIDNGPQDVFQ